MNTPPIVSPEEWKIAWEDLLVEEKELTRARAALPPRVGACAGWRSRRTTASKARKGRPAWSICSRTAPADCVPRPLYRAGLTTYAQAGGAYRSRPAGCSFLADQVAHPPT